MNRRTVIRAATLGAAVSAAPTVTTVHAAHASGSPGPSDVFRLRRSTCPGYSATSGGITLTIVGCIDHGGGPEYDAHFSWTHDNVTSAIFEQDGHTFRSLKNEFFNLTFSSNSPERTGNLTLLGEPDGAVLGRLFFVAEPDIEVVCD